VRDRPRRRRSIFAATPSGSAEFLIDNPKPTEQLVIGEFYYVDFNPVPKTPVDPGRPVPQHGSGPDNL
jgi:hypothetical protein